MVGVSNVELDGAGDLTFVPGESVIVEGCLEC